MLKQDKAKRAVVRVGDGRGFVVEGARSRIIITAAHCLGPTIVPCASFSDTEDCTYASLLGKPGEKPTVWTECFFIDPIVDIAVLGPPDDQALSDEWDAYDAMVGESLPLSVSEAPKRGRAWLLSPKGRWFQCDVLRHPAPNGALWISGAAENIVGGMSGSPILADDGSAIGILCTSCSVAGSGASASGGPNPRLASHLPGWLLREIGLFHIRSAHAVRGHVRGSARKGAAASAKVRAKRVPKRKGALQ
jgi:hypothetical protein